MNGEAGWREGGGKRWTSPRFLCKAWGAFPLFPISWQFLSQPPTSQSSAVVFNKLPLCTKSLSASGTLLLGAAIKPTKREQLKSKVSWKCWNSEQRDLRGDAATGQHCPLLKNHFKVFFFLSHTDNIYPEVVSPVLQLILWKGTCWKVVCSALCSFYSNLAHFYVPKA